MGPTSELPRRVKELLAEATRLEPSIKECKLGSVYSASKRSSGIPAKVTFGYKAHKLEFHLSHETLSVLDSYGDHITLPDELDKAAKLTISQLACCHILEQLQPDIKKWNNGKHGFKASLNHGKLTIQLEEAKYEFELQIETNDKYHISWLLNNTTVQQTEIPLGSLGKIQFLNAGVKLATAKDSIRIANNASLRLLQVRLAEEGLNALYDQETKTAQPDGQIEGWVGVPLGSYMVGAVSSSACAIITIQDGEFKVKLGRNIEYLPKAGDETFDRLQRLNAYLGGITPKSLRSPAMDALVSAVPIEDTVVALSLV